jgi:glycosyltransferase involved in cell wall biosynthesis
MKRAETEKQVAALDLRNVIVLPPVPKDDARLYINAADLCLVTLRDIPLFDGAIPTKLIDYMACGKAVLCGIRGEAERIVDDAGAGVMFEPDNDEQLSELVAELLQDAERVERMGAGGLAYVQSRFAAATMREQMESVLLAATKKIQSSEVVEGRLG